MSDNYSFSKKFLEGETLGTFWNLAFYGIVSLNSFIIVYFLGVYEYGLYQLVLSVGTFAESLTSGFVSDLVQIDIGRYLKIKRFDLAKRLLGEYAFMQLILAVMVTILFIGGATLVANHYGQNIGLFLKITGIALVFRITRSVIDLFFDSSIYFKALSAPVFGETVKLLAMGAMWFWQGLGITQILIAYVVGNFFSFVFSVAVFLRVYRRVFAGVVAVRESLIKNLFKMYGYLKVLRYFSATIAGNLRPWFIKIFISTEAVGLFVFARNIIAMIVRLMPLGTFGLLLPHELDDKKRLQYLFNRVTKYSVILGIVFTFGSLIFMPVLVNIFFPKYKPALPLFLVMTAIIFLYSFYKVFRMMLTAFKEQKVLVLRSLDESILAPLLLLFLLPVFGVMGAAIEWVLTYTVTTILFYKYLTKLHPYIFLKLKDILVITEEDKTLVRNIYKDGIKFLRFRPRKIGR